MDLEFPLRQKKDWRAELKEILFTTGDIVKAGERGEKKGGLGDFEDYCRRQIPL